MDSRAPPFAGPLAQRTHRGPDVEEHMQRRSNQSVTVLLDRLSAGDEGAFARLIEAVYSDVRTMSEARLRRFERGGPNWTVQPTVIAHDVLMDFKRQRSVP